ncbi:Uma2 family endonuclease [Trichothermofontia sp.]
MRKKFTVEQYERMIEVGILTDRDRVELFQGEVLVMAPVGPVHTSCVNRLAELFVQMLAEWVTVRVQGPIQLGLDSLPQPDLAILRWRSDFYTGGYPQAADVWALVEVADTTIAFDRSVRMPLYAQGEIPEVWVVDLTMGAVHVYREPCAAGYQRVQIFCQGEAIAFQAFPDVPFTVDQLLG